MKCRLSIVLNHDILSTRKVRAYKAAYPPSSEGLTLPDKERRAMPMYVTYSDVIQIGILLVALASLLFEIYKGRK